jgi:BAG domain
VISEVQGMNGAGSDHSGSGDDSSSIASNAQGPRRRRAESTTRPPRSQYEAQSQQSQPLYQTTSHTYHNPSVSRTTTRTSNENLRAPAMEKQSSRQSSTGHHSPPRAHSPMPPVSRQSPPPQRPAPAPTNAAIDPNSPLGKVNALAASFHTQWLVKCTQFIMNPPSDPKTRDLEYVKLTESVMAQIVLKADNIEMEGDTEARASRKQLVNEASEVLKRLDAIGKRKS